MIIWRNGDIFKDQTVSTFFVVVYQGAKLVWLRLDQDPTSTAIENIRTKRVPMGTIICTDLNKGERLRSELHHQIHENLKHWYLPLLIGRSFEHLDPA